MKCIKKLVRIGKIKWMKFFVQVKDSQVKQKCNPSFLNDFIISNIKSLQISEKIYL